MKGKKISMTCFMDEIFPSEKVGWLYGVAPLIR
jgi:hypothetical protein